jgi:hypothetical protein
MGYDTKPEGEPVVDVRPLFLRADEIVHSQQDTLWFREFIQGLEVHVFSIPDSSSGEGGSSSGDDDNDGYPSYDAGRGLLRTWPQVYRLEEDVDEAGNLLPSLPWHGRGASWSSPTSSPASLWWPDGRSVVSSHGPQASHQLKKSTAGTKLLQWHPIRAEERVVASAPTLEPGPTPCGALANHELIVCLGHAPAQEVVRIRLETEHKKDTVNSQEPMST